MNTLDEKLNAFRKLLEIMDELREKCPWDRRQTNETLRNLTIEETYELADAIIENNPAEIKKELGDLMLHIVFYAKIGAENQEFDIGDVINSLNKKLINRHPHVFSDTFVKDHEDVKRNWEELKMREGKSVLKGVPKSLPAMIKANRIQEKVRAVGFDWEEKSQKEVEKDNQDKIQSEFGDLFFSLINAARLYNIDPETALEKTNKKFIKRFNYLEKETLAKGHSLKKMTLDQMNEIWERSKDYDEP